MQQVWKFKVWDVCINWQNIDGSIVEIPRFRDSVVFFLSFETKEFEQ